MIRIQIIYCMYNYYILYDIDITSLDKNGVKKQSINLKKLKVTALSIEGTISFSLLRRNFKVG